MRPWNPPRKAMNRGRAGGVARQLQRRFHGFGAGIGEEGHRRSVDRVEFLHDLGEPHLAFVPVVGGDVQKSLCRFLDGGDHGGMAVPGGAHGDPGGEIDEAVAVHVPDFGAATMTDRERVVAHIGMSDYAAVAVNQCPGFRAGECGLDVGVAHRLYLPVIRRWSGIARAGRAPGSRRMRCPCRWCRSLSSRRRAGSRARHRWSRPAAGSRR